MTIENEPEIGELFRFTDVWYFAVLLSNGLVLAVDTIERETENFYVMSLIEDDVEKFGPIFGKYMVGSSCSRRSCYVAKKHVIAIQEFMDS